MYNDDKRRLNTREWTKHQNSIKKLDPDYYKRKGATRQNNDRMDKDKRIGK